MLLDFQYSMEGWVFWFVLFCLSARSFVRSFLRLLACFLACLLAWVLVWGGGLLLLLFLVGLCVCLCLFTCLFVWWWRELGLLCFHFALLRFGLVCFVVGGRGVYIYFQKVTNRILHWIV